MGLNRVLPHQTTDRFLTYTGYETDLIFTQGIDLPGFASFPLLETDQGRAALARYYVELMALGQAAGMRVLLEAPTWLAHADRGAALGYDAARLAQRNAQAIAFLSQLRLHHDPSAIISANIGPRRDAYAADAQMSVPQAQEYHAAQLNTLAQTPVDLISAYTFSDPIEVIGLIRAANAVYLPVMAAFTVETNGRLANGMDLAGAIAQVDDATDGYAAYYMVNCAHPDHMALIDFATQPRVRGIVANASRCSHAELDQATVLDAGDPVEFGQLMAGLLQKAPQLTVLGGCCGTDFRHLRQIATCLT
ncbi:homocysteine S-methyltransferase family protein [Aestuariibius sp. HNIBRBA575]|uniref:homocysteine S-methyltransferase family protein n=1 Tax=Aestuariibius sp. HNIBRBA575 TaxID=3233343 RepID=UPI0034A1F587